MAGAIHDQQRNANLREGEGKRALITGLRGFTGFYMARELVAAGYRVFGTVMPGNDLGTDVLAVDLCDREAVAAMVEQVKPDVVVHLAGIAFVAHSNVEQIYRVNVVGTRNLLEALAAVEHKASCVLLASSANVYGNASVSVIDENVPVAPANDYAVSKLAMEYMARLWMDNLPIVVVRPFNYTGVGQGENFLLPKIVSHFRRKEARIELGNLAIVRDFSDVRMVVSSYRKLLAAAPAGETFNICSGRSYSLGEVIELVSEIAGYRIDVQVNPAFVRANDVLSLLGSNDKLARVIGPLESRPLVDTLRWMVQS
ncbi:GDP-mannose 4,6-dehydratase [Massilia sp. Mn16-1_5]|uniref:GDP-mannose 4,6-dehydratase n=1 Tax=Massilia sp. Mn16-1_5 TaxID=2079199 RepID=UPI00109E3729|nr:GDP-mannose 4,6-dehydratase [Massilia sp. Mn16-1_5]THC42868.1 GDP-mannose 4,6 dehydratase [Massilia sp. Mn16-1_5]